MAIANISNCLNSLNIGTFNCYGLKSSLPYVIELLKFHDIIFINEHWLQKKDLDKIASIYDQNNYCTYLKSSIDPMSTLLGRPYGGVGFLCKRMKGVTYRVIPCESDRIMGLQIIADQKVVLCLLGVYLPCNNSTLAQTEVYIENLDYLQSLIDSCEEVPLVILGDTNTVLPENFYLKDKWYAQKPFNRRSLLLYEFITQNNLCGKFYVQTKC